MESEIADYAKKNGWFDEIEESWIYGVEVAPDFSKVIGEPVLLLQPPFSMDDLQAEQPSVHPAPEKLFQARAVQAGEEIRSPPFPP